MSALIFDDRICELGEGPLWHPVQGALFWFDILGKRLLARAGDEAVEVQFDEHVSAAGWTGDESILIASESQLIEMDIPTGAQQKVCDLEADNPMTRSNDGRADRQGGFWIGTMGKAAEPKEGAIYRYYRGELRKLYTGITIPNSICFAPEGDRAYFSDTVTGRVLVQELDALGWPRGEPRVFLDLRSEGLNPDGAVTDMEGRIWNAQWGASRVACYSPDGAFVHAVSFEARHTSCPAFGGEDLGTLFCTTAREHLSDEVIAAEPLNGQTFQAAVDAHGWAEPQVIL